ncbi:MAG: stage 0 sporulation protein [Bacilli bacterium]|nr:stage 0 sporulation protein [Bacilli bacterium]
METDNNGFYLGIRFQGSEKSYYFSCPDDDFALGDLVIVMTANGVEAGQVSIEPKPLSTYNSPLELKSILRKADQRDIRDYERNLADAKKAMAITRQEVANLNLAMDLIDAFYTIDGSKITITYTSTEKRVDFRELLKVLAPQIGCRIELRQIAARDKAKMVGGLGICGLPLCCSTFLNQFEGISIQRAKNQMLTLNIPKLSGPCGKLICCLMYEDDAYTEAKKEFPHYGTVVKLDEGPYTVDAINILSKTIRLVNATRSDYKTFSLEDVKAMLKGTYVRKVEIVKAEDAPLPSFGIDYKPSENEKPNNPQSKNQKDQNFDRNHGRNNRDQRRHGNQRNEGGNNNQNRPNNQRNNNQPRPEQPNQGQGGNDNRNKRHRHRHGRHGDNRGEGGGNGQ